MSKTIKITIKSFNPKNILSLFPIIKSIAQKTGAVSTGIIPLPNKRKVWTIARSPHVYSKHRDQYGKRDITWRLFIRNCTKDTLKALMEVEIIKPVEVSVKEV